MIVRHRVRSLRLLALALGALPAVAAAQPQIAASPAQVDFGNVGTSTTSAPEPITVNNESGSANLVISSVQLVGPGAAQFTFVAPTLPKTILASENLILTLVTYAPSVTGHHTASLIVTAANGQSATVALEGTGVDAKIEVTPMAIDLGTPQVGTTSGDQSVTITNHGGYALTILSVQLEGANADSFQLVSPPPANTPVDANGGDLSFGVNCHPTTGGTLRADVLITSSDTATPALRVQLTCVGEVAGVQVVPAAIPFGSSLAGGAGAATPVVVTNSGGVMFSIDSVEILPANQTVFGVTLPANLDLGVGQSKTLTFTFDPATTDEGVHDATAILHLSAGLGTVQIPLHGVGVLPHLAASAATLLFADQRVGTQAQRDVRLTNTGGAALRVTQLGGLESPFSLLTPPTLPLTLAPNETVALTVAFTPTGTDTAQGTLNVESDDPAANVVSVEVQGRGIAPRVLLVPTQVEFGPQRRTTTSAAEEITVTNTGSDTLSITSITLGGADADVFSVSGLTAPVAVDPGQARTMQVRFAPPQGGDFTATITLATDDPDTATATVTLTGTGTAPSLTLDPGEEYSFPEVYVGKQTAPVTFTVTNSDSGPLPLGAVRLQPASADFVLDPGTFAGTIGTGQAAAFTVAFAPQTVGAKTAVVEILVAGDDTPVATITLHGTGATSGTSGGCAAGGAAGGPLGALLLLGLALLAGARRRR
ncbi:MAG TPA: choice-of-anchor D domain-containing protein [Polyangia bacterium]|jgi:MYXO-CTERM domain-containing protein